jgi:hypothetical protein
MVGRLIRKKFINEDGARDRNRFELTWVSSAYSISIRARSVKYNENRKRSCDEEENDL